jgi:hypothetical protein
MNDIEVIEPKRQTSLTEIAEFELLIDAQLPQDYKQFLLKHNGGHPIMDAFDLPKPINKNSPTIGVSWFYSLYDGEKSNLIQAFKNYNNQLSEEFIPIAYDSYGKLCLVIKGENYGKVYYYTTNWSFWKEEDLNYLYFVSATFTDFINGLYQLNFNKNGTWTRRYQDGTVTINPDLEPS